MRLAAYLRAFRYRNYRLFWSGQLISLIGTWVQMVGESWLVYRLTGNAAMLGLVACASQLSSFFLSPFGGAAADRLSGRRLLLITESAAMVLAFGLALLTLSHRVLAWHVFAFAVLFGAVSAFAFPARQVFLAETVAQEDLMNAIAINASMINGTSVVGPALAGILVASVGEGWCFILNSLSYIAVLAGLWAMRVPSQEPKERQANHRLPGTVEGFRFVRNTFTVRNVLLLLALVCLLGVPHNILMPIFADRILRAGPGGLGVLMGASGCGALLGALTLVARPTDRGLAKWIASGSLFFGAALGAFAFSRSYGLSVLLMVPAGYAFMIVSTSSNTLIQLAVPDDLRGRVMSICSMALVGAATIGTLLAGISAHAFGAPATVAVGAIGIFLSGLAFSFHLHRWRDGTQALHGLRGTRTSTE